MSCRAPNVPTAARLRFRASRPKSWPPNPTSEEGLDANDGNAQRSEARMARCDRSVEIDAAAGLLDHHGLETCAARVLGRVADTEIKRQSNEEQRRPGAFA